jgi:hypothetical protein
MNIRGNMLNTYNQFQYHGDVPTIAATGADDKNSILVWMDIFQIRNWRSVVNIYPYMDETVIDEATFVRVWNRAASRATGNEPRASHNVALPLIGTTFLMGICVVAGLIAFL